MVGILVNNDKHKFIKKLTHAMQNPAILNNVFHKLNAHSINITIIDHKIGYYEDLK